MSKQEALMVAEPQSLAVPTPMRLIEMAMTQNLDADKLGQLMDLQLRWEANEARKAYITAKQEFQKNAPTILKTKKVAYQQVSYSHAELDKMWEVLIPELSKYGLGFSWKPEPSESGKMRMSCVLSYSNGVLAHREVESTIEAPPDTTGSKNAVQGVGSSMTYLQRYSLFAALGIVAKNQDDDGRASEGMSDKTAEDFVTAIKDSHNAVDCQKAFAAAWNAAKAIGDKATQERFRGAYDAKKREFAARSK